MLVWEQPSSYPRRSSLFLCEPYWLSLCSFEWRIVKSSVILCQIWWDHVVSYGAVIFGIMGHVHLWTGPVVHEQGARCCAVMESICSSRSKLDVSCFFSLTVPIRYIALVAGSPTSSYIMHAKFMRRSLDVYLWDINRIWRFFQRFNDIYFSTAADVLVPLNIVEQRAFSLLTEMFSTKSYRYI